MYEIILQKSGRLQEQLSPNTISVKHERQDELTITDLDVPTPRGEAVDSQQHLKVVEILPRELQYESPIKSSSNARERSGSNDTMESDLESLAVIDDRSGSLQLTEHDWHILLRGLFSTCFA